MSYHATLKTLLCRSLAAVLLLSAGAAAQAPASKQTLPEARKGFQTKLVPSEYKPDGPAEKAAPGPYQLIRYTSPAGKLSAYLTKDPGDGKKRPAIVWAHGGFGGIGDYYTKPQPAANDQTPKPYLDAGFVVMIPSWRGENDNPGKYEMFYGEVDDALAAVDHVSKLPYVDPNRIYFAGHSTGGTMTLLTALSTNKIRAAFSFGGAPDIARVASDGAGYGNTPFNPKSPDEGRLRSAINFVQTLRTPTWYFEGESSAYVPEALEMARRAEAAKAPFKAFSVKGGDHFDILRPLNTLLAAKLAKDTGATCNVEITDQEVQQAFAAALEAKRKAREKLPLVVVTPAAARVILQTMRQNELNPAKSYLVVEKGKLDLTDMLEGKNWTMTESNGVRIAIPTPAVPDVRGTLVDFDPQEGGFRLGEQATE